VTTRPAESAAVARARDDASCRWRGLARHHRRGDDASMASRRRHAPSTRPRESLYVITDAVDAPFLNVNFPRAVLIKHLQRLLEARRVEQEHQVVVAAVADELYDFGIVLYGGHDFFDACVDIDQ